jgi:hypothetical protein
MKTTTTITISRITTPPTAPPIGPPRESLSASSSVITKVCIIYIGCKIFRS